MSNDLISRQKLLEIERLLITDIVKNNPASRYIMEQVLFDIENIPAAYDVDKVVEQMETTSHYVDIFDEDGYNDDCKEVILPDKAIKIVKSGGVSDGG